MRLLVTRPQHQADDWVARLRERGVDAHALPLIAIVEGADPGVLHAAWAGLAAQRLAMFVSPNAVSSFFAARPPGAEWPGATLAGSTGPGTTQALAAHGVARACIVEPAADAAQFDSEALWQQLASRDWQGASVLVVRGAGGRDWLAEQLAARGATVQYVESYRRERPRLRDSHKAFLNDAIVSPEKSIWLFSSSQAVHNLLQLAPSASWQRSTGWASHPRIAQAALGAGFGTVQTVAPTLDAIVAEWTRSIQSKPHSLDRP